jgi:hypothetical protein
MIGETRGETRTSNTAVLLLASLWIGAWIVAGSLVLIALPRWMGLKGTQRELRAKPRSQATDFGNGRLLTITIESAYYKDDLSFDQRGLHLIARRPDPPTGLLKRLGHTEPKVLGAGPLTVKGRKVYYQALLEEPERMKRPMQLISTTALVDCRNQLVTTVTLSQTIPTNGLPIGPGADMRGTPADPQFVSDELELSSEQLCTGAVTPANR